MRNEFQRKVTFICLLGMALIGAVFALIIGLKLSGIGSFTIHTADGNLVRLGLTVGSVAVGLFVLAELHRRGREWPVKVFTLILIPPIILGFAPSDFNHTIPQSAWLPVLMAIALTNLRWTLLTAALTAGLILWRWAGDGAYSAPAIIVSSVLMLAVLLIGRLVQDVAVRNERRQLEEAESARAELKALNAELESRVDARTAELSSALQHIQRTQDDLIQSEKLASLGSMVAGISHELNTPIGNAVTVASTLSEHARTLVETVEAGPVRRTELVSGLNLLAEMSSLIDRSVNRAATLVASFKQVAVDQMSEQRREFDVHDLVEDILTSLRPGYKTLPWELVNDVPSGIRCDSFPGPLGQVVTNLIQNAVLHAFEGRSEGRVEISAKLDEDTLELAVRDDGKGMHTATLTRIFEPFFTTKLGTGGSGLGLSICRRIVNNILAGELTVLSSANVGTCFTLRMPARTPGNI